LKKILLKSNVSKELFMFVFTKEMAELLGKSVKRQVCPRKK